MKHRALAFTVLTSIAASGCGASIPGISTGALGGGAQPAPVAQNDPTSRAMQVGMTSARALKCGYNFDPAKLRTNFLASEAAANPAAPPTDATRVAQVYDTSFNGVSKAVASQGEAYCTPAKTTKIKEALHRHLAGDYTPDAPEPVPQEEGLFGSWSSSGAGKDPSMKHPIDDLH